MQYSPSRVLSNCNHRSEIPHFLLGKRQLKELWPELLGEAQNSNTQVQYGNQSTRLCDSMISIHSLHIIIVLFLDKTGYRAVSNILKQVKAFIAKFTEQERLLRFPWSFSCESHVPSSLMPRFRFQKSVHPKQIRVLSLPKKGHNQNPLAAGRNISPLRK